MSNEPIRPADRFLVFGSPAIEEDEVQEVADSIRSGWLGTGPKVARFVDDFGAYLGADHVAAVNSGTAAMHLSMVACGLEPGDEVITTAMTFCSTVNAIIHAGATPVLVDCEADTMNIDPAQVERALTERTRAIMPVHVAGRPCEMDRLCAIADAHDLKVIGDCAHAIETEYHGRKVGTYGDFAAFSFYVTKNVITGEGGMVVTRREKDVDRIRVLALHGLSKDAWKRFSDDGYQHYYVHEAGFKYNMMDIQAAIGIHQLARIESNWQRRQEIWQRYDGAFAELPIATPLAPATDTRHAYHLYTIMVDGERAGITRDEFLNAIQAENIGVGVHYLSVPEHPYYQKTFGWRPEDFPNAMRIGRQTVSLPLSAKLSDEDVSDVVAAVRKVLGR